MHTYFHVHGGTNYANYCIFVSVNEEGTKMIFCLF